MRVIAGTLGGRLFQSPKGHRTHPMSEKARGAIFNALGDIEGLTFLDAYAGSGAVAIEAISRGAKAGVAIDIDVTAWKTIVANVNDLGIEKSINVVRAGVTSWSTANPDVTFDLIFADPPYDALKLTALRVLPKHLKSSGIFILSWPGNQAAPDFDELTLLTNKQLGDIQLFFYRR